MADNKKKDGRGWYGDPEGHAVAGQKGGLKVSANRDHMSQIGKRGGQLISIDRDHMSRIGKLGGAASHLNFHK